MGSPSVGSERLRISAAVLEAGRELARYCRVDEFSGTLWSGFPRLMIVD